MPYNPSTGVYSLPAIYLAIPGTVIIAAQHNTPLEDLATANNYARPVIAGGTGANNASDAASNLNVLSKSGGEMAGALDMNGNSVTDAVIDGIPGGKLISGDLYGLTLANNAADATNDIDIDVGSAASDGTIPFLMTLLTSLTKRLDATWAVGSGNGGRDTGSIGDNTYHVWLIQRSDTGVVDALFSLSATSPTMPANYDRKRRIGSIIRSGGAIRAFTQRGDDFSYTNEIQDRNSTSGFSPGLFTISAPAGIVTQPKLRILQSMATAGNIQSALATPGKSSVSDVVVVTTAAGEVGGATISSGIFTDTSSRVQLSITAPGGGTLSLGLLLNQGWIDSRGRN